MITGISDGITWKSDKNDLFTLTHLRIFKLSYFFPKVINMTWTHAFVSFGSSLSVFHEKKKRSKKHQKSIFFSKKIKKLFFLNFFFSDFFTVKYLPKMWNCFLVIFSHIWNIRSIFKINFLLFEIIIKFKIYPVSL